MKAGSRLQDNYPDHWATILSGELGVVTPLQRVAVYAPIFPDPENRERFWVILHTESRSDFFTSVWSFRIAAVTILKIQKVKFMTVLSISAGEK